MSRTEEIEIEDFECPYCGEEWQEIMKFEIQIEFVDGTKENEFACPDCVATFFTETPEEVKYIIVESMWQCKLELAKKSYDPKQEEVQKDVDESVFCSNCYWVWELTELPEFLNEENNQIAKFCPNCNWNEFITSKEYSEIVDDKILSRQANAEYKIFDIPKNVLRRV